jgi:predicted glutamine amidotransferase
VCELLLVRWPRPEPFSRALRWALDLERLGIAGFGWGVAWVEDGRVRVVKDTSRINDDRDAQRRLAGVRSERFLVHLRRPSLLSTSSLHDTQPFLRGSDFAFSHNGSFTRHHEMRHRFEDRLMGAADSEVGFRKLESLLVAGRTPAEALPQTHREMGGEANLGYLGRDGVLLAYAGHPHNDFWTFTVDGASVASTALHSADQSLFDLVFRNADQRRQLHSEVLALGRPAGSASVQRAGTRDDAASPGQGG